MKNKTFPCIVVSMINHVSARYTPPEQLIADIFDKVYKVTGISPGKLKWKSRKREIVYARQLCMYLLKKQAILPIKEIAPIFNKDRTTFLHAMKAIQNRMDTEPDTYDEVMGLLQEEERKTA